MLACVQLNARSRKGGALVVAYVTSWAKTMPDPTMMTHINYAFGKVNATFNGVNISNPARLRSIVALKKKNPALKVLLSVGGWGAGNFSEMAARAELRKGFCNNCRKIVDDYGLDGIDIDWEYPGSAAAGISHSPQDRDNFSLLLRDLRAVLGKKLLTIATAASASDNFYDFKQILKYVNFINIMSYDLGYAPRHNSPLYSTKELGENSCDKAFRDHLARGVPAGKCLLGLPFYGRGNAKTANYCNYRDLGKFRNYKQKRHAAAMVPYMIDSRGEVVMGYDDAHSLRAKCKYALKHGMLGVMYWDYDGDDESGTLRRAVWRATR